MTPHDTTHGTADDGADARPGELRPAGRVAVVIGSTRPGRITPGIARWFRDAAQRDSPLRYELVDLAEVDLPFLDEPLMAALGRYEHEHTKAWSRTVAGFDGFVFVFPQYNWGYPAPLKNALDFLYAEWSGKPASFVTFGTRGGSRAAEQFRGVLAGLDLVELDDHLEVVVTRDDLDDGWQLRDLDGTLGPYRERVRTVDAQLTAALAGGARGSVEQG
jgi:NAD(P)H-dependent FMN reductase